MSGCTERISKELNKSRRIDYRWCLQAQEKAESVWHEPELQKQPKKLTEPWKELSQEPQTVPQHTHLHHLKSSLFLQAFTRISFPSRLRGACSQTALDSPSLFKECCWKLLCLGSRKKFKPLRQPLKPSRTSQPGQRGSCPFSRGQAQLRNLSWNAPKNNSECHLETSTSARRQPRCTTNKRCQGLIYSLHRWGVKQSSQERLWLF